MVLLYWFDGWNVPAEKKIGVDIMAADQLSFLDESGLLRSDCICKSDAYCALCGGALPPRKRARTLYWLAGRPPRRICRICSLLYSKCFDKRLVASKRGVKL